MPKERASREVSAFAASLMGKLVCCLPSPSFCVPQSGRGAVRPRILSRLLFVCFLVAVQPVVRRALPFFLWLAELPRWALQRARLADLVSRAPLLAAHGALLVCERLLPGDIALNDRVDKALHLMAVSAGCHKCIPALVGTAAVTGLLSWLVQSAGQVGVGTQADGNGTVLWWGA